MCYRCSDCSNNWPLSDIYHTCPLCKEKCWTTTVNAGDALSFEEARALVKAETEEPPHKNQGLAGGELGGHEGVVPTFSSIHGQAIFEHRYGAFMRMGFGPSESEALAETREDTYRIRKMLDNGCTIDVAVSILL